MVKTINNKKTRKNNRRMFFMLLILLLLIGCSVGYAVLSTQINITGKTKVRTNAWNIYIEKVANVVTWKHTIVNTAPFVAANSTNTTELTYDVELVAPGDYYQFDFVVKNSGTIPAILEKVPTLSGLTTEQAKYITHTITTVDGDEVTVADSKIAAGGSKTYRILVKYNDAESNEDLPTSNIETTLKVSLDYVQD